MTASDDRDALILWSNLVPPPDPRPQAVDWEAVHLRLGTVLPRDYRGYVDLYGIGCVNELYWVLHPDGVPGRLNLFAQLTATRDLAAEDVLLTPPPVPLGLLPGGLLPCAVDEDAGVLYWHADASDPDLWTVVYRDEDGGDWMRFSAGLVAFLYAVFTGGLPDLGYGEAGYLGSPVRFESNPFA